MYHLTLYCIVRMQCVRCILGTYDSYDTKRWNDCEYAFPKQCTMKTHIHTTAVFTHFIPIACSLWSVVIHSMLCSRTVRTYITRSPVFCFHSVQSMIAVWKSETLGPLIASVAFWIVLTFCVHAANNILTVKFIKIQNMYISKIQK